MIGVPRTFAKKAVCRAGLHPMTEKNTRIEVVRRNDYSYRVRRCKACQTKRETIWRQNRKRATHE